MFIAEEALTFFQPPAVPSPDFQTSQPVTALQVPA